ncbi:MAG: GNAT family N-acetyltransferase [Pseudomonadota bacterium]
MNPPTAPILRPATNADQENVRALVFAVLDEYEIDPAPKTTDRDLYDIEDYYRGGSFDVLVSEPDGIIGTVGVAALSPSTCELRKMYLRPKYRGRGHGARLLKHAIGRAQSLGFSRMELNTKRIMEEAIGLYAKFGFRPMDGKPVDARCDQTLALDLKKT